MLLSGRFLGISLFTNKEPNPTPIAYNKIKFYGNCIVDDIHIKNVVLSDTQVLSLTPNSLFEWDSDTILLATFENSSINGGNITTLDSPITKWNVNRKLEGGTVLKELGEVDSNTTEFIDYTAQHNKSYIYDIFPITDTEIGEALQTDVVTGDFYSWSLTDVESETVYLFDLNLASDSIKNVTDVSVTNNYTQFPNISYGNTDYIQGGISCILGNVTINGQLYQPIDYIEDFQAFINNGKEKLLKNRKGELYFVHTLEFSKDQLDDAITDQPYVVSFQFIQSSKGE